MYPANERISWAINILAREISFRGKIGGKGFILTASSFSTASSANSFLTEDQIRFHHRCFLPVKSRGVDLSNVAYLGVDAELLCTLQKFDLLGSRRGNPRVATTEPLPLLIVNCHPVERAVLKRW
jgi:hypothetical protein